MPQMLSVVVDDDPVIRTYISTILQREHFQALEAANSAQALEILRKFGGDVNLIVTDIQMYGGDGLSLARLVKEYFPTVQIILVSGYENPNVEFEFVQKPFTPKALLNAVHKVLANLSIASVAREARKPAG
jgi:CheY-like chemotaxis protein